MRYFFGSEVGFELTTFRLYTKRFHLDKASCPPFSSRFCIQHIVNRVGQCNKISCNITLHNIKEYFHILQLMNSQGRNIIRKFIKQQSWKFGQIIAGCSIILVKRFR